MVVFCSALAADAQAAIEKLNQTEMNGRTMRLGRRRQCIELMRWG